MKEALCRIMIRHRALHITDGKKKKTFFFIGGFSDVEVQNTGVSSCTFLLLGAGHPGPR